MLAYFIVAAMLLASDQVSGRPRLQTIETSTHQHSPIIDDEEVMEDFVDNNANSINHVLNKREKSDKKTSCRPRTVRRVMEAPMLFVKLNDGQLTGLSFATPMKQSYDECVFDGCTEQQIQRFKKINKRTQVTFHYDALSDLPDGSDAKPGYKFTYTKYFTQCQAEQIRKPTISTLKSDQETN